CPGRNLMRHFIRRWLDWAMTELLPPSRPRTGGQSVHLRYEKAGQWLHAAAVPWNAENVSVEVLLNVHSSSRHRSDFLLRIPGLSPITAEQFRQDTANPRLHRLTFRLPTPSNRVMADLTWKHKLLTTISIPILTEAQFLSELQFSHATTAVRLRDTVVPAQTFISSQCKNLLTSVVLRSPTGLAPLADLGIAVVFESARTGQKQTVPVPLTSTQFATSSALLTAVAPTTPRTAGDYTITWTVSGRPVVTQRVTAITQRRFLQSLRVLEARFVVAEVDGGVRTVRQPPAVGENARIGPCFILVSREVGSAAVLDLDVGTQISGSARNTSVLQQNILITDGPTVFAPGLLEPSELESVIGFELRYKAYSLGVLSFRPVPSATINAEGAFKPAPDFTWSSGAEEELTSRLSKLMDKHDAD
ncbi:MAG: hypothetical protein LC104_19790, partial [Bacteroidales bacterium]|nr:hypothetical protein [Bacteroidales bacterium]